MSTKQGNLSINSENIFPIIKKWLYSDHDIFFRELISNGCDAITKLKKLEIMGEYSFPEDYKSKIEVIVNPEEKTLKFIDNGIGMTAEEVEEYITQIAFSGATEFLEKYKDKTTDDQMIGHFGLGFYSAFMVADEVHIDSLSYKGDAPAVHWTCDGGTVYEIGEGTKDTVGTEITLFLNEESLQFANEYKAREVISKYCSFMPVEIFLTNANAAPEEPKEGEEPKVPESLSDTHPLWMKHPSDCTDEEYKEFYRKVFLDYKEPLFWIHLNMDYPFNLKGILYFPKINTQYDSIEGTIKLYNNQVFIADNIKEVIPEFLMLLKGVIDCPDLPLNVSRSALQNDGFVTKISDYISKKVADKLTGMCKTNREAYESYWDDISPFIKFGCIKDAKFAEKLSASILFKDLDQKYLTLADCIEKNKSEEAEEETSSAVDEEGKAVEVETVTEDAAETEAPEETPKTTIYYITDEVQQSQYINLFKDAGKDAVYLTHTIDTTFISHLEQVNDTVHFQRIDSEMTDDVSSDSELVEKDVDKLTKLFQKTLGKEKLEVSIKALKNDSVASMITVSEESRRMQDMMKMYSMGGAGGMDPNMFGTEGTLVLNSRHPLVQYLLEHQKSKKVTVLCEQLYDLALLSHKQLTPDEMTKFIARSNDVLLMLTK
ncbi:MAG: molecular chaperone HtpG [Lachnospiraceae bacterium]